MSRNKRLANSATREAQDAQASAHAVETETAHETAQAVETETAQAVETETAQAVETETAQAVETESASKSKSAHSKTEFGHWLDSTRGVLDTLMNVSADKALTIAQLAERASVSVARVRVHVSNLKTQERGGWGPKVVVHKVDTKVFAHIATESACAECTLCKSTTES